MTLTDTPSAQAVMRRRLKLSVIVVVLVVVVAGYFFWWSRPAAFGGWGNEIEGPLQVGQTLNVDMGSISGNETVSLHGARAVVVRNSADAVIEFVVCDYKGEVGVGAAIEPLADYCSTVSPLAGYRLPAFSASSRVSIIARITPRRSGGVGIEGMEVSYTRGWKHLWQTGSEQAGIGIKVTVP